jgi:hypothetical protein
MIAIDMHDAPICRAELCDGLGSDGMRMEDERCGQYVLSGTLEEERGTR